MVIAKPIYDVVFKRMLDIEEIEIATDILHHSGTNPAEKLKIENEQEAIRTINAITDDLIDNVASQIKEVAENKQKLLEKSNEKDKQIA